MIKDSFLRLGHTFKELVKEKRVFLFLLAFFFYIDGVYTVIDMATAYGQALGLNSNGLLFGAPRDTDRCIPFCFTFQQTREKSLAC